MIIYVCIKMDSDNIICECMCAPDIKHRHMPKKCTSLLYPKLIPRPHRQYLSERKRANKAPACPTGT